MMKKLSSHPFVQAVFFMLFGGTVSAFLEYEVMWDYVNYHHYNGFAFLNGRLGYDIAPASVLTYFNPLLDAVTFLLSEKLDEFPTLYAFLSGFPFGLLLFIGFLISGLLIPAAPSLRALAVCVSGTGFAVFSQIGTSSHELFLSVLILTALYLLGKELFSEQPAQKKVPFLLAGLLLGAAAGLKYTTGIYCVCTTFCLLVFYKRLTIRQFLCFACGGAAGFLATNGFWMYVLYKQFQNPFFPLFNKIFDSPFFLPVNYTEKIYLANRTVLQTLLLPFILIVHFDENFVGAVSFSDARWAFGTIIFFLALYKTKGFKELNAETRFFVLWTTSAYLLWLFLSSVVRYAAPVEILIGIFIIKSLFSLKKQENLFKDALRLSLCVFSLLVLLSSPFFTSPWGSRKGGDFVTEFDFPKLPEDTLVALYGNPTALFLSKIAMKTPQIRGISFVYRNSDHINLYWDFVDKTLLGKQRAEILKTHKGPRIAFIEEKLFYMMYPQKFVSQMSCADIVRRIKEKKEKTAIVPYVFMCWSKELDAYFPNGTPFAEYVRERLKSSR